MSAGRAARRGKPAEIRYTDEAVEIACGEIVVSRLPRQPGPTHTIFDVMAAAALELTRADRIVVLGFAAGSVVAPLRALGFDGAIHGVDLDPTGEAIFRETAAWAGKVEFHCGDAVEWLEGVGGGLSLVIDDLSVEGGLDVTKPFESVEAIPRLVAERLGPGGVFLSNLLPMPGSRWGSLLGNVTLPFACAHEIRFDDYENRFAIAGSDLPLARKLDQSLHVALATLGSRMAEGFRVHSRPARSTS